MEDSVLCGFKASKHWHSLKHKRNGERHHVVFVRQNLVIMTACLWWF